jgi:hypothetical protein
VGAAGKGSGSGGSGGAAGVVVGAAGGGGMAGSLTGIGGSGVGLSGGGGSTGGGGSGGAAGGNSGTAGGVGGGAGTGPKKTGELCTTPRDCASGSCANGVCCASECNSPCLSCALPGSVGICAPLPPGTSCSPPTCNGNMLSVGRTCDGKGTCTAVPLPSIVCTPYACNAAAGTCNTACMTDADCFNTKCVNGSCRIIPIGATCTRNTDCATGFCSDGQCCNIACQGPCVSCALPGRVGKCWPVDSGAPDPRAICRDQGPASCGLNGLCDGNGGCASYPLGTVCSTQTCSGDTLSYPGQCNGLQACVIKSGSCTPFNCRADVPMCKQNCTGGDADCDAGFYCGGANFCVPKKAAGNPCQGDHECVSNFCSLHPDGGGSTCVAAI